MSDIEVDLEMLNQVDQEHQIPQNLDDAMSERLESVIKKHEPEKFGDQPMSLGDRNSYYEDFETNNLPKEKKAKQKIPTLMTCLHYIKTVQTIIIMEQ